jgi:hypothetical protein
MVLVIIGSDKFLGRIASCAILLKAAYKSLVCGKYYGRVSYDTDDELSIMNRLSRVMTTSRSDTQDEKKPRDAGLS